MDGVQAPAFAGYFQQVDSLMLTFVRLHRLYVVGEVAGAEDEALIITLFNDDPFRVLIE